MKMTVLVSNFKVKMVKLWKKLKELIKKHQSLHINKSTTICASIVHF